MTIRYKCDECGAALNIKDELAGTNGRCPKCKAEFVVPPAPQQPVPQPAVVGEEAGEARRGEKSAASARSASGDDEGPHLAKDLSDDDIESILEGKDAAPAERGYGVAARVADIDDDDDDDDDTSSSSAPLVQDVFEEEDDEPRPPMRRKADAPPPGPAVSVSNVARGLMAKGEKGAKIDKDDKRGGRAFGGDNRGDEGEGEEGFTLQEKVLFIGKFAGPVVAVIVVISLFASWYLSWWQKGSLPSLGTVTGTVLFDDQPLKNALVQFIPIATDPKASLYSGSAAAGYTNEQGKYTLYYTSVPGAPIGNHLIRVEAYDPQTGRQFIPAKFSGGLSVLREEVKAGRNEFNFDLKSKDPNQPSPKKPGR